MNIKWYTKVMAFFLTVIVLPYSILCIGDFFSFHAAVSSKTYFTPWYQDSWRQDPYTKFCLSQYPASYHLATNGVGDIWVVKEVKVGKVEFWTIKYKILKGEWKGEWK